ncbi:hypothetical protein D3C73_1120050 [compost metagenome]
MQYQCRTGFRRQLLSQMQQGQGQQLAVGHRFFREDGGIHRLGQPGTGVLLPHGGELAHPVNRAAYAHRRQPRGPGLNPAGVGVPLLPHGVDSHLRDHVLRMPEVA